MEMSKKKIRAQTFTKEDESHLMCVVGLPESISCMISPLVAKIQASQLSYLLWRNSLCSLVTGEPSMKEAGNSL